MMMMMMTMMLTLLNSRCVVFMQDVKKEICRIVVLLANITCTTIRPA